MSMNSITAGDALRVTRRRKPKSDITGKRFNRLTALYPTNKRDAKGSVIWHCRCDCGNEVDYSYNELLYTNLKSCGCQKEEHDMALRTFLTHVDGTSIDALKSDRVPSNNTTGVKGVYRIRGKYVAKIVFKKKQYILGQFDTLALAAEARKKAEQVIRESVVDYYAKYAGAASRDPKWAEENPIKIFAAKAPDGELFVKVTPELDEVGIPS